MTVIALAMAFGVLIGWLLATLYSAALGPDVVARCWWCEVHQELAATNERCPHGTHDTPCQVRLAGLIDDWR